MLCYDTRQKNSLQEDRHIPISKGTILALKANKIREITMKKKKKKALKHINKRQARYQGYNPEIKVKNKTFQTSQWERRFYHPLTESAQDQLHPDHAALLISVFHTTWISSAQGLHLSPFENGQEHFKDVCNANKKNLICGAFFPCICWIKLLKINVKWFSSPENFMESTQSLFLEAWLWNNAVMKWLY